MTLIISTTLLSYGTQNDDVARVQQALQARGKDIPKKLSKRVLGGGTLAVLKALQTESGLPVSGVVDEATVRAINTDTRNTARCQTQHSSGNQAVPLGLEAAFRALSTT